jgi:hypothetical protein
MNEVELVFLIGELLQKHLPESIKDVSVDGDSDSAEIIIDVKGGKSFVISSNQVREYED